MLFGLGEWLSGPPISWMPTVMLVFLLAWQPWQVYSPTGSVADLCGKCATVSAVCGLLIPSAWSSPWLWVAITVFHFGWIAAAYHTADNHQYLIGYWYAALCVALLAGDDGGSAVLERNGELLIGLCFACAVFAKLSRRRYRDGSMFTYLLLLDSRFMVLAAVLGGVVPEEHQRHRAAASRVRAGASPQISVPVGRRLQVVAVLLTWWTIAIETLIALLFALPLDGVDGALAIRLAAVGVFVCSTYVMVPVPGFGQIILIMLMATVSEGWLRGVLLTTAVALSLVSFLPQVLMRLALARYRRCVARTGGIHSLAANAAMQGAAGGRA